MSNKKGQIMDRITSTEFQRDFGRSISNAKRKPVTITSRDRDEVVVVDAEEFEMIKAYYDKRKHFLASELPQEDTDAIAGGEFPSEGDGLDHLLK